MKLHALLPRAAHAATLAGSTAACAALLFAPPAFAAEPAPEPAPAPAPSEPAPPLPPPPADPAPMPAPPAEPPPAPMPPPPLPPPPLPPPPPVVEAAPKVEAPAPEKKAEPAAVATAAAAPEAPKSPFGLTLGVEQGFGLQTDDDTTSAALSFVVSPSYSVTEHTKISVSIGAFIEETENPGDARRADIASGATFLRVANGKLFVEELTGLKLSGSATAFLPLSRNDVFQPKFPTLQGALGVDRTFFGINAKYAFSYSHYFPAEDMNTVDHVDYGLGASPRPDEYAIGGYLPFNRYGHNFSLSYTAFEKLSLGASVGISTTNSAGPSETSAERVGGAVPEGSDANSKDLFSFGVDAGWQLDDVWSVGLGFSNGGLQRPTGQSFGGPGSDSVNGGPLALLFSEQNAALSIGLNAGF